MTKRVVDALGLIEVEVMNRQHSLAVDPPQRVFKPVVEQHAVGEVGQGIGRRRILKVQPLRSSTMLSVGTADIATLLRQCKYSSRDIAGKLPASKAHFDDVDERGAGTDALACPGCCAARCPPCGVVRC